MAIVDTGGLRKGLTIELDNELVRVVEYQHIKQGRGSAFVRLTMRNLRTGSTTERTFQAGSKFTVARLERQTIQYLYREEDDFHFMNTETYEQFSLPAETLGGAVNYLKENETIDLLTYQDKPIDVEVPVNATLRIERTDPGLRGDTASGGTKPATLETGLVVNVPLFLNEGDLIRVDTRTGQYLERVTG
ncbi:MAG: Translation elongation factor P [uncultured Thermomicrobiales bacterium]|uniref:Elongation factor P n=1 Tax=uncultured Thermomicrobiales bacterium TaxID=1645740 RepID=A0A6J4VN42_9BACT|nr:MAG: Translation elongation factor P [uncultured Thermomicrobiales bacterium]